MLIENVSPAADQPEYWAVGQPLVTLMNSDVKEHVWRYGPVDPLLVKAGPSFQQEAEEKPL
eukprot:1133768-Pelagomonas_calceolata.AAC.2